MEVHGVEFEVFVLETFFAPLNIYARYSLINEEIRLHFYPILVKLTNFRQILVNISNTKFRKNPFSGARMLIFLQTDRHVKANGCIFATILRQDLEF
jgi:hypothetical protein